MDILDQKKRLTVIIAITLVLILAFWFLFGGGGNDGELKKETIVLKNSNDEEYELTVEIADEDEERKEGLMNRDSLCEECGMLFVYGKNVSHGFWMKDTYISLSIAFISENGTINEIQYMQPRTLETHRPNKPYRYALEVNQGYFSDRNIEAGDVVEIPENLKID